MMIHLNYFTTFMHLKMVEKQIMKSVENLKNIEVLIEFSFR